MSTVIKVENLSKQYQLGQVGTGTMNNDLKRWWHRVRGKEDPFLKIGEENDRTKKGTSDFVWALRDMNFSVKDGEVLGIIGRNGAGKSTLLKILSRTTAPTTGTVKIKGRIASLLEVGTGFHPELSGRQNVFLNGAILGMTNAEIKKRFDEIVDFAGVERYIDTPVKRYSSGMYVRLAFGVAAHLEPEILIVDEVLAVGDAEFQKKCLGKMKDVSVNEGRTVLFVSHNLNAIENLCTQGLYLKNGQIHFNGNIKECLANYAKVFHTKSVILVQDRKDRIGNGKLRITNFYFKDTSGNILNSLKSGLDFSFVIEFKNNVFPDMLKNVVASIALIDQSSNRVVYLVRSNFSDQNLNIISANGSINCAVKNLALANGDYSAVAYLGYGETEVYDLVENIAEVLIEGGDFFGNGNNGMPNHCKSLSKSCWLLEA